LNSRAQGNFGDAVRVCLAMAEATTADAYTTVFMTFSVTPSMGAPVEAHLKAYVYTLTDDVFWELRRILEAFYRDSERKWFTHKFVKSYDKVWRADAATFGGDFSDWLKPSLRAYDVAHPNGSLDDPFVREEFTCRTRMVMIWLARWAYSRKDRYENQFCTAFLEMLFARTVRIDEWGEDHVLSFIDGVKADCPHYDPTDGQACPCLKEALVTFLSVEPAERSWRSIVQMLSALLKTNDGLQCPAMSGFIEVVTDELSKSVDAGVAVLRSGDVRAITHLHTCQGKRRRIDADFKRHIASVVMKQGRCHNAAQFLRASTDISCGLGRSWEHDWTCEMLVAQRRALLCSGVCGSCEDGARNGKPAEETTIFLLWCAVSNRGAVLPFMVLENNMNRIDVNGYGGIYIYMCLLLQHVLYIIARCW
jgi:hypothetical protein